MDSSRTGAVSDINMLYFLHQCKHVLQKAAKTCTTLSGPIEHQFINDSFISRISRNFLSLTIPYIIASFLKKPLSLLLMRPSHPGQDLGKLPSRSRGSGARNRIFGVHLRQPNTEGCTNELPVGLVSHFIRDWGDWAGRGAVFLVEHPENEPTYSAF